jgi:hypothetical protein
MFRNNATKCRSQEAKKETRIANKTMQQRLRKTVKNERRSRTVQETQRGMRERERGREEGALEIPRNVHAHALGILKFHTIPQNINAGAAWNLGTL